jgi:hypothetical protein
MAPKKNKKGNKKGGSGLSSPTPGFSASSSKAPEDLTIGTTGEAFSKTSPKSPESKIPIITTPATPRSPPGSADLKGSKDKLAIPTSPPKKLFAPLGDGELTPKPLKFGKNDSSDTTPKPSAFGDKNPYGAAESLSNLGEAARVGDDFAPQEPLQVMMATDGGEGGSGGNKGKGNGKGKQPEGGGSKYSRTCS